jgi:Ankyrin repeats (3 copies)
MTRRRLSAAMSVSAMPASVVSWFAVIALVGITFASSGCRGEAAPHGGAQELALVNATTAVDVVRVTQLLVSGADPNKMVRVGEDDQSAWFLALEQMRPQRPDMVEIVRAMLKSGANPNTAWGTHRDHVQTQESTWRRFWSTTRTTGTGSEDTLHLAMLHPVPEVVRAIVGGTGFDPRQGEGALVSAIESHETEIVHILVEAGVDVNTEAGANTPLVAAIEARDEVLMTYLEAHGAREKP